MGKKGAKRLPYSTIGPQNPVSLREEATGNLHKKLGSNFKSMLKLEHLRNLAVLASCEVPIPSFGAFYGQTFAIAEEAMGIPPDPSLIACERCEIVLHPGFNCTIRVENRRTKGKHRRIKSANITQNNVAFKCHYCLHLNLKNGTFKGHIKGICPAKKKPSEESKHGQIPLHISAKLEKGNVFVSQAAATDVPSTQCSTVSPIISLNKALMGSKRKSYMCAKKDAEKATSPSSKRRRKSWTSLNEIARRSEYNTGKVAI